MALPTVDPNEPQRSPQPPDVQLPPLACGHSRWAAKDDCVTCLRAVVDAVIKQLAEATAKRSHFEGLANRLDVVSKTLNGIVGLLCTFQNERGVKAHNLALDCGLAIDTMINELLDSSPTGAPPLVRLQEAAPHEQRWANVSMREMRSESALTSVVPNR